MAPRCFQIAFFVCACASALLAATKPGKPVELNLTDLSGNRVRLQDYRGKIVVLNFWATWCVPCKEEMPLLVETEKEYMHRGVVFIAASLDESKTKPQVSTFATSHGVTFPIWTGATADNLDKLKMGEGVPATAFIDQEGHIVARVSGEIRKQELKERIDWLLSDRSSSAPKAFVNHLEK